MFPSPSFWGVFIQLLHALQVRLDMVCRDTVNIDRSPQATDPRLETTTNPRSPDTLEIINEINEDTGKINKIYHFQNCGTVYMPVDSFNARGIRMENCGNNVPQITCSLSFSSHFCLLTWPYRIIIKITILRLLATRKFYIHNLMQSPMVYICHLPLNILNTYSLL